MYVPSAVKAFGSSYKMFTFKTSTVPRRFMKYIEVKRTHKKYLDNPHNRCTKGEEGSETTACIGGHPYMTSSLRGGDGVSPKEDVVREVA